MGKSRNYAFTAWDGSLFSPSLIVDKKIHYMIMGKEICPETKKVHYQGFFSTINPVANGKKILTTMGFSNSVHIEVANGTPFQNFKYCSKDENFLEWGTRPTGQGRRSDLENVKDIVKSGGKMIDIIDKSSNYQSLKMGEFLLKYLEKPREIKKIDVYWLWGESGSGKTKWVYDKFGTEVFRPVNEKWWEGYDGHKIVLLDDFRPEFCSFVRLLQLTDIYPFKVECKGGSRHIQYHTIIITAPVDASTMWRGETKESLEQIKRRITLEQKFGTEVKGNTNLDFTKKDLIIEF